MSFGLDKCAIINIKKGKQNDMGEPLDGIKELTAEDSYKYLGLHQTSDLITPSLSSRFKKSTEQD